VLAGVRTLDDLMLA